MSCTETSKEAMEVSVLNASSETLNTALVGPPRGKPDMDGVMVTDSVRLDSMTTVATVPSAITPRSAETCTWFVCAWAEAVYAATINKHNAIKQ